MSQNRTTPCAECPFRRKSARGWLGGHKCASEIIDLIRADARFPCHMSVNAELEDEDLADEDDSLRLAQELAATCVGGLAFMNNTAKLSRDPRVLAEQRQVGKRNDCFSSAQEMIEHHQRRKVKR